MKRALNLKGFTLIELLIVVAIIAILAAIAVPNFLEAQTRSKVSRAKADMRTLATGLESYYVDYNAYPKGNFYGYSIYYAPASGGVSQEEGRILSRLSSPVAFMTTGHIPDPFPPKKFSGSISPSTGAISGPVDLNPDEFIPASYYRYYPGDPSSGTYGGLATWDRDDTKAAYWWILQSTGPDLIYPNMGGLLRTDVTSEAVANHVYDPTNGTVSFGSIFRIGGTQVGTDRYGGTFTQVASQAQK